jgi:hypothetical protein
MSWLRFKNGYAAILEENGLKSAVDKHRTQVWNPLLAIFYVYYIFFLNTSYTISCRFL